ncbi:MAG: hypothetical protein MJZ38_03030 [archaeon]|nr:hypothetical protein [archaeon]
METKNLANGKLVLLVVLVAMLATTTVSAAYSYSSTVTTSGSISAEYLTINVYDMNNPESARSEITFTVPDSAVSPAGVLSDRVEVRLDTPSKIRVTSSANALGDDHQAQFWGYFTASTDKGVTVESLELELECNGSKHYYTIYRDAYKAALPVTLSGTDTLNADLVITKVVAHYYSGVVFIGGDPHVSVSHNGSTPTDVGQSDAISLNGFEFHFLASRGNLLQ